MHLLDCYAFCMDYVFMQVFVYIGLSCHEWESDSKGGNSFDYHTNYNINIYSLMYICMYICSCAYIGNTIKCS